MARPQDRDAKRLTVEDWIAAGFSLVAEEGQQALKIDRLCGYLGVTKGSFYWHFDDIAGYRGAVVRTWAEVRDEDRKWLKGMSDMPPRQRLATMMATLVSPRQWVLERAMREWARLDPAAAASVRASDRRMLKAVREAYRDYGFEGADADLRAEATFAAGVGFLHLSGVRPSGNTAARQRKFLDFMLRP